MTEAGHALVGLTGIALVTAALALTGGARRSCPPPSPESIEALFAPCLVVAHPTRTDLEQPFLTFPVPAPLPTAPTAPKSDEPAVAMDRGAPALDVETTGTIGRR